MKNVLLIFSLLLSCLSGGDRTFDALQQDDVTSSVIEATEQNQDGSSADYRTQALIPVQPFRFAGEDTGSDSSVRSSGTGRRTQVTQKSPFIVIKDGKVIDKSNLYFFLTELRKFPSGIHSSRRYIHTIRQLLI